MTKNTIPFLASLLDGEVAALVQDLDLSLVCVQKIENLKKTQHVDQRTIQYRLF